MCLTALYFMWEFIPVGGYVIFDDITTTDRSTPGSKMQCWQDFKRRHVLREELLKIDWGSSFFRKVTDVKVDWDAYKIDRENMLRLSDKRVSSR